MTPVDKLPENLLRFLDANVESIEQLEILRILGESPERSWSAPELVQAAQTPTSSLVAHLSALEGRGLLTTQTVDGGLSARHGVKAPHLDEPLAMLLRFYKEHPVTLIKLVYARAGQRLAAFAEAFRLRKES